MPRFSRSFVWLFIVPLPIAIAICSGLVLIFFPHLTENNARQNATAAALQMINQIEIVRSLYGKNVVSKVVNNSDLSTSVHHKTEEDTVPPPATFILDISEALSEQENTRFKFYSPFPFENRQGRQLDGFQQQAWDFLVENPNETFVRQETVNGQQMVRVAVADVFEQQSCVDCHNAHPASLKTGWNLGDVRGVLEIETNIDAQLAQGATLNRSVITGTLFVGLILTLLTVLTALGVSRPLRAMTHCMKQLAAGKTDVAIPGLTNRTEVGEMASAVEIFRDNAVRNQDLERQQERRRAADQARIEKMEAITSTFQNKVTGIVNAVSNTSEALKASAQTMTATASRTYAQSDTSIEASERTAANIEAVVESAADLAVSIKEIKGEVDQSQNTTRRAVTTAQEASEEIKGLETAAQKIGDVVKLITEIAEQTHLLALNATIEAARAGEAGKGFAVVAGEVKNLADQTAKATEEISAHIEAIQSVTKEAVSRIEGVTGAIDDINSISQKISAGVEEQRSATESIAGSTERSATDTRDVNGTICNFRDASAETKDSAQDVLAAATELSTKAKSLEEEIDSFLASVKEA